MEEDKGKKNKPFHFEAFWLKEEEECRDVVASHWGVYGSLRESDALMSIKE